MIDYDHARQQEGEHEFEQMLEAHNRDVDSYWSDNPCDTLSCEPDFPGDKR